MSDYEYGWFAYPFDVAGSDADFTFRNATTLANFAASVADGTYINSGLGPGADPTDFIRAFRTAAQAAATAIAGVGGTITASLGVDGQIVFVHTGNTNNLEVTGLTTNQKKWLGVSTSSVVLSNATLTFQAGCMWRPGIDQNWFSANELRSIVHADTGLAGNERVLELAASEWNEVTVMWDRVAAARMKISNANDAEYCTVAGIALGEANSWENLWRYLKGEAGPYGDNRVYYYTSNVVASAVQLGPYQYLLSKSAPGVRGIEPRSFVPGLARVFYPVMAMLKEIL